MLYSQLKATCTLSLENLTVSCSYVPMGFVTKYLQKLGMGAIDSENQPGVFPPKRPEIWSSYFSICQLEVKTAEIMKM